MKLIGGWSAPSTGVLAAALFGACAGLGYSQTTRPAATRPAGPPATQPASQPATGAEALVRRVEEAHGLAAWQTRPAVAAEIALRIAGTELSGTLIYDHHRGRVRIDTTGGPTLVFDGERAWISPAEAAMPMARFHLLTWPYFLAAPFKLRDPGARLEATGPRPLDGVDHETALLTFEAGTGDSPDDWYVIYEDPESHRLAAMAYIVTYGGKSVEEAEQEPHVIVYRDFQAVDGATLSARWTIHDWSDELGAHGPPLAEVTVRDLRFVTPDDGAFAASAGAREESQPGG